MYHIEFEVKQKKRSDRKHLNVWRRVNLIPARPA